MKQPFLWMLSLAVLFATGCADAPKDDPEPQKNEEKHEEHAHPEKGPHEGKLIELGEEEYHAELVLDKEAGTTTIYILDAAAKEMVPIEATEITVGFKNKSHPLKAETQEDEPMGQASKFVTDDESVIKYLSSGHFHAKLILKIGETPYSSTIDSH